MLYRRNTADIVYELSENCGTYTYQVHQKGAGCTIEVNLNDYNTASRFSSVYNPMHNVLLRIEDADQAVINRQYFGQCVGDIARIGNALAKNLLLGRLFYYELINKDSFPARERNPYFTIVYCVPELIYIAPRRNDIDYSTPTYPNLFGERLSNTVLGIANDIARNLYVLNGRTPDDLVRYTERLLDTG